MSSILEKDWITAAGYRAVCLIICFQPGIKKFRNGYVAVPKGHPFFEKSYSEQLDAISQETANGQKLGKKSPILLLTAAVGSDDSDSLIRRSLDIVCEVHGGLTYSGGAGKYPVPGEDLWWFGFDCGHAGDGVIDEEPHWPRHTNDPVRSLEYVVAECESLAKQLKELSS